MGRDALVRPSYAHALAFASVVASAAADGTRTPLGDVWAYLESEAPPGRASLRWAARALYAAACARACVDHADALRAGAARLSGFLVGARAPVEAGGVYRRALGAAVAALDLSHALALVAEHAARGYARAVDAEAEGAAGETRRALLNLAFWSRARRWLARDLPPRHARPRRRKVPTP